jgi:hypothetical protein
MNESGHTVRFRTAADKKKALTQYEELRRSGRIVRAVVIAEMNDQSFQVLGQSMSPQEIGNALMVAAAALEHHRDAARQHRLEPHQEPDSIGPVTQSKPVKREITLSPSGVMIPPEGENIISCGECHHPRWYVLHHNKDDTPARYACASCGNEVKFIRMFHRPGAV